MSLYDDASLVMIPSGYKDQKVYSAKPTDGSGDLTFSRGSDIEATRIGSDGYIHKAKVNVLLQSNTFSNASWVALGASVTSGQSGYDGTSDAWLLSKGGASGRIYQNISFNSVGTFSVYAKAASNDWIWISENNGVGSYFDLGNGVVGTTTSGLIERKIEDIGGGWYRCSITAAFNFANIRIYPADGDGDVSGTSGNVYIQDAQLNYGLVAQEYQETTTAAVVTGITNDMPRLSYDPANPTCCSLLLEPSRTNIIADSEFFNNTSVWTPNANITIDDNQDTSPEGVVNASRIYNNTGSDTTIFYGASVNVGSAGTYTFSIFAKKGGLSWIRLRCLGFDAGANNNCYFDLENGVKGTNTFDEANIEDYGNGWFRISVQFTTSTDLTGTCYVYGSDADNDVTIPSGASNYVSVYGAQLEKGSYPSSYIPTYGTSATRTADAASKTGISSLIGQTEGTLFGEFSGIKDATEYPNLTPTVSDGTNNNRIMVYHDPSGSGAIYVRVVVSGTSIINLSVLSNPTYQSTNKIAFAYKANDYAVYFNGTQIYTNTSAGAPPACSKVDIFNNALSNNFAKVEGKQTLLFKTRLPNSDLATLTTL